MIISYVSLNTDNESKIPLFCLKPACGSANSLLVSSHVYSSFWMSTSKILKMIVSRVIGLYLLGPADGIGVLGIGIKIPFGECLEWIVYST